VCLEENRTRELRAEAAGGTAQQDPNMVIRSVNMVQILFRTAVVSEPRTGAVKGSETHVVRHS